MEFISLPPEVSSALIHSGPGAGSLIEASGAWQRVGSNLEESASSYAAAVSTLTEAWHGPSASAMVQAVGPYVTWLRTIAQECQQQSASAQAAAAAFGSTIAAVVHPSVVSAHRIQLAQLLATNRLGRNLPAIAETEAQYQEMWVNNSAAMHRYQATSEQAVALPQFSSPPSITNLPGLAAQASVAPTAAAAAPAATAASPLSNLTSLITDPGSIINNGYFQLANTYANQFISSGFPINLLSYAAQNTSAQALQTVAPEIGAGLSEGESALGASAAELSSAVRALGTAPTAAVGVGVSMGNLTAPPAVVGLLPLRKRRCSLRRRY